VLFGALVPSTEPDNQTLAALPRLHAAGLVTMRELVALIAAGAPLALCRGLVPDEQLALLDPAAAPPAAPPCDWEPTLTPLLALQVAEPRFWRRWPDGPSDALLGWLEQILSGAANVTLVQSVIQARAMRTLTSVVALASIAGALDSAAACHQVMARAYAPLPLQEREQVMDLLSDVIRAPLLPWLAAELTGCAETGPPPPLTVRERLALVGLLHPTRDIVRPVLACPERVPEEAPLLEAVYRRLLADSLLPPLPPPPPALAALRPDWVARLATLPGWGHWAVMAAANSVHHGTNGDLP
jgi:hypothetical protein